MAAYALAHRVWEQNWETIVASDSSEGTDTFHTAGWKYGTALQQLQNEKSRAMVSCEEALQQLQEAQQIQYITRQTDRPTQLMQQYLPYHPTEATAFQQKAEGFVELAEGELGKRKARLVELGSGFKGNSWDQRGRWNHWQQKAQETATMAQRFKQTAADAVSALETAFSSQEWDHRIIFKAHDFELARMEAEIASFQDELQLMDHFVLRRTPMGGRVHNPMVLEYDSKIKATEAKMKEEYMQRSKTRRFMHKIGTLVKLEQFKVSKKKKRLQLKHQDTPMTAIDN